MKISVELHCPSCSGTDFEVPDIVESHMDYIGIPCVRCGHKLTEREVGQLFNAAIAKEVEKGMKGE